MTSAVWQLIKQVKAKHDYIPWNEFEQTTFTTVDGQAWHYNELLYQSPLFVITACCPYSIDIDHQCNYDLHQRLKQHLDLRFPLASIEEIIGRSVDGQWQELSWAVTGIDKHQALAMGRMFHQWAIFSFDQGERSVLRC